MFYNIPDVRGFVQTIIKYRLAIITFFTTFLVTMLFIFSPSLVSTEELFWLNESKAYEKTQSKDYDTNYLSRLTLYVEEFDQKSFDKLYAVKKQIAQNPHVLTIESLFSAKNIYKDGDALDSSLVKMRTLSSLNAKQIRSTVAHLPENFSHFCDEKLNKFYFYIYSKHAIPVAEFDIELPFDYSHPNDKASWDDYLIYVLAIFLSIVLLFRYLFKNYFSSLIALLIISITLVTTMALTDIVTGINAFHLSMVLIVVAVSLVDYLYFYYRWHVSQYKADVRRAMTKTINRNLYPALWTSFLTIVGLGSLLFVDSIVVKHLSISVIAASTVTYVLNILLLPALLSYFKVEHPRVGFARLGYIFADLEVHYSRKFFYAFMLVSFSLMLVGGYQITKSSQTLFENSKKSGVLTARLPLYDLDYDLASRLYSFEENLKTSFSKDIDIQSAASMIRTLHQTSYPETALDESHFLEAKMFLELYGLDLGLIDENSLKIIIRFNPELVTKTGLLSWIETQDLLDLYFTDVDSLMSRAKSEASLLLAGSAMTALLFIGLIMGLIFRSKAMMLIAFAINSLPMVWFGFVVYLLGLPLSIEALIAMTISLALGSDASVHFAYKYFRSRFFERSLKHSLEKMFFYAGIPVLIGSLILSAVFITLTLTSVHSLQLIGMYGAILMIFSLITDLFVLPVMLIAFDKYFTQRGDVSMLYEKGESCSVHPKE